MRARIHFTIMSPGLVGFCLYRRRGKSFSSFAEQLVFVNSLNLRMEIGVSAHIVVVSENQLSCLVVFVLDAIWIFREALDTRDVLLCALGAIHSSVALIGN